VFGCEINRQTNRDIDDWTVFRNTIKDVEWERDKQTDKQRY